MKCKEVNTKFIEYLDKRLNATQKQQFEDHISTCTNCKKAFDSFIRIYGEIEFEKNEFSPNPFLGQKIWNKINVKEKSYNSPILTIRRVAFTSIAAAGLFIGILMGSLINGLIFSNINEDIEQSWTLLTEEYFPSEIYKPYEELANNELP
jgi:predicted anti-sigma-YlaC factor YlaD